MPLSKASVMTHTASKLVHLVLKPIQIVTESVDFVLQPADDLVSLLHVHMLPGLLTDPFGFALEVFGRFVHIGLV